MPARAVQRPEVGLYADRMAGVTPSKNLPAAVKSTDVAWIRRLVAFRKSDTNLTQLCTIQLQC